MSEFIPNIVYRSFTATIEDNVDPLKIGRVRARVHGYHTHDHEKLPTEDLPWANLIHEGGNNQYVPEIGDWVFGVFLDGEDLQKPIIFGVIPGLKDNDEPQTSPWARNENIPDDYKTERTEVDDLQEPENPYNAEYPHNKVIELPSGSRIEYDDTPGYERIHIYHKSGSFVEFHPDGKVVYKSESDTYEISKGDSNEIVKGDKVIRSEGKTDIKAPTIELNGNGNNLVTYQELNSVLKKFAEAFNNAMNVLNTHTHIGNLGYPTAPMAPIVPPITPFVETFTSFKADSLKTDG